MFDASLTKERADELYNLQKCVSDESVAWNKAVGPSQKIAIGLIAEDGTQLEVQGWFRWKGSKRYGFALLYEKSIPIRRWDDAKGHVDKCSNTEMMGPHKHYYHPKHFDSCSYETKDVRQGDVNGALLDFCEECHISFGKATYQMIREPQS
jgi:hypothetical protein